MKLKTLVALVALVATGSVMVACGSGSTNCNTNTAPVVAPLDLPNGFVTPSGSTSGIRYNVSKAQLAIPAQGTYNIIQLTTEQALRVAAALEQGSVIAQQVNGTLVIAAPASVTNPTTVAESAVIIVPQTSSTQSKAVQSTLSALTYTISIPAGRVTFIDTAPGNLFWLVYGTTNGVVLHNYETHISSVIQSDNANCSGIPSTVSLGANNNSNYVSWGTQGEQGKVCVADINTLRSITNLTAKAPAANDPHGNGYQGGAVNYLGFASTQGTGKIVGFWNVNNQIYKVIGNSANNTVTPVGFLNTTSNVANQKSNATTTGVQFTGFPAANAIYSTYVDQASNVWVGSTDAKVYVLRNGQTQWTNVTPSQFAGAASSYVTVSPQNGHNSGATATVSNLGGAISVSVN